jgi:hypothetical protein
VDKVQVRVEEPRVNEDRPVGRIGHRKENRVYRRAHQNATEILGNSTDSSTILDSMDVSTEDEDQTFFDAKGKCIDTVLERTLQTDQGKCFGPQHEKDFNAQHIYASYKKPLTVAR